MMNKQSYCEKEYYNYKEDYCQNNVENTSSSCLEYLIYHINQDNGQNKSYEHSCSYNQKNHLFVFNLTI